MLAYIDNLSDDSGFFRPGTNVWDLRGDGSTTSYTPMSQTELDTQFDGLERSPAELLVAGRPPVRSMQRSVAMEQLATVADAPLDVARIGRSDLDILGMDPGRALPVPTARLTPAHVNRLVALVMQGGGDIDEVREDDANVDAFLDDLDDDDTSSVRSVDVPEASIQPVTPEPSSPPMRLSELQAPSSVNNDRSWIGRGASMLQTTRPVETKIDYDM